MRIADAQWIPSTPHQTWDALMDPAVLQKCLPGCVHIERRSPTEYALCLQSQVGGVESRYEGEVLLSELNPPHSCSLAFEGKSETASLAIGTAQIQLADKDDGTRLAYTVAAMAGGSLAKVGEPLLLKAGNKVVSQFFAAFIDHMAKLPRTAPPPAPADPPERGLAASRWSWAIVIAVVVALVGYHAFFK
ncbi:carbon monoxide dehydrogenase subunit G [Bordetella sp. 15P40C-2]|uniref:SRPBCC family protein n=1 Tax=Bordetella sp. 15P40C-2 TaxID=2572246 RepID=UPI00132C76BF|nr:carbon monoxide dehydrogenase subunit G [Bordetella sp. 15P40C-2]MVW71365.1 carbon monoxide dehydrogenase [Bordetella sp. 15P40C-2]